MLSAVGRAVAPGMASLAAGDFQMREEFNLTPTQAIHFTQVANQASLNQDQGVHARLISLVNKGLRYGIRKEQQEVLIGRHPHADITVDHHNVSAHHVKIYRDEAFRYFVEELSSNGCFINEHSMKKGDTRALRHGDEISLCVPANGTGVFAAFIFSVGNNSTPDSVGSMAPPSSTAQQQSASSNDGSKRDVVTEQWVNRHWDMRTELGSGNFSQVRLGIKVDTAEKRAVKVIDKKRFLQFQNKRESHLSLNSEAEVLTSLSHPHIVKFYEWFETDVHLYLVMELLPGGDLLQCILEHKCFTEPQARRSFHEVCEAVRYLHSRHIVHRDLKPENILLTSKDRETMHLKLADFGLARKNLESKGCRTFCGTPHYFAPEVINTFKNRESGQPAGYGKQADMWSLGVILYVILSGIPPFEEDGLYEQILEGKYEFDVREWTTISPEAKELVRRLMTVNPRDRLKIEQAMDHKWFKIHEPLSPAPDARLALQPFPSEPKSGAGDMNVTLQASFTEDSTATDGNPALREEPTAKRRRTANEGILAMLGAKPARKPSKDSSMAGFPSQ